MKIADIIRTATSNQNPYYFDMGVNEPGAPFKFRIYSHQWDFVLEEIDLLNELLQTNRHTRHLRINEAILAKSECGFRYFPFTAKTKKISKNPCVLDIQSRPARNAGFFEKILGYGASIYYTADDIRKGELDFICKKFSYTIDFKTINGSLEITKVIQTDSSYNNTKLYHKTKDGAIIGSK